MKEALSRHAEEAYAELATEPAAADGRSACSGRSPTRSPTVAACGGPTSVDEIAEIAEVSEAEVVAVAEVFRRRGRSFLMPPPSVPLGHAHRPRHLAREPDARRGRG